MKSVGDYPTTSQLIDEVHNIFNGIRRDDLNSAEKSDVALDVVMQF